MSWQDALLLSEYETNLEIEIGLTVVEMLPNLATFSTKTCTPLGILLLWKTLVMTVMVMITERSCDKNSTTETIAQKKQNLTVVHINTNLY